MYGNVWAYKIRGRDGLPDLGAVWDAAGVIDAEVWVAEHGVQNFPDVIYFLAELVPVEV